MRGLIGENLKHSFSKIIHEHLCDENYYLLSLSIEEVTKLLVKKDFEAINVTIPYKEYVINYLDVVSDRVKKIGACNTIVNKNGVLHGYNTDYYGFGYTIVANSLNINNKTVLVIGKGGSAKAIEAVLYSHGAKEVIYLTRSKRKDSFSYDEIDKTYHVDMIVNCSPMGMVPNIDVCDIDLSNYTNCKVVADIVYNPLNTKLMLEARKHGMKAYGGIEMLVAQAYMSATLFDDNESLPYKLDDVIDMVLKEKENIVLIGMPYSGKSELGKVLNKLTKRPLHDVDKLIENLHQKDIRDIFEDFGEETFRNLEADIVTKISRESGAIIVCGGGVVLNHKNIEHLKQNGRIIWLQRDENEIEFDQSRPLAKHLGEYKNLYKKRESLYRDNCDCIIVNQGNIEDVAKEIIEKW